MTDQPFLRDSETPRGSPENPRESLVVLALEVDSIPLATELANRKKESFAGEIIVVCCAKTPTVVVTPQSGTIVPVPAGTSIEEARRIGVAHATGDVIRVTTVTGRRRSDAAWPDRLSNAGVRRSSQRNGQP